MSSFWDKHLQSGEELILSFGVGKHYLNFVLVSGLVLLPIMAGIFILGRYFYLKYARRYAFTNRRVISWEGWFSTHLISVDYDQITDLRVRENFIDKFITKTGTLIINTAGRASDEITILEAGDPQAKVNLLYSLIEKDEQETG